MCTIGFVSFGAIDFLSVHIAVHFTNNVVF